MSFARSDTGHSAEARVIARCSCRLGAGYVEQLRVLSIRAVRTRRFEALGFLKFVQFIAVAIVAGLLWLQRAADRDLLAAQDTAALCFFELVCSSAPAPCTGSAAHVVGRHADYAT